MSKLAARGKTHAAPRARLFGRIFVGNPRRFPNRLRISASIRLENSLLSQAADFHHGLLGLRFALLLLIVSASASVSATDCPALPAVPAPTAEDLEFESSWQGVAEPFSARYAARSDEEPSFGVGFLDLLSSDEHDYFWLRDVVLPLWKAPDEASFSGWIHRGRIDLDQEVAPHVLTGAGLVATGNERSSFIVYEVFGDGWLRIRLRPGKNGEAWTHQCHLGLGGAKLIYWDWEYFLRKHGDWLHFRSRVPHSLRASPDVDSPRVTLIGLDHKLVLREIRGDWMHVVVEQPDRTCVDGAAGELEVTTHEGWVKWRDEKQGPWVWVYTRGC